MSTVSGAGGGLLDGTFTAATFCDEYLGSGADADVDALLDQFNLVIAYRERIGIDSRAIAKQFDGFRAPRYRWEVWAAPGRVQQHWRKVAGQTYVEDAAYDLHALGDYVLCTVTAEVTPQSDIDPETGERWEHAYGLRDGDVSITGVLADDATLLDEWTDIPSS